MQLDSDLEEILQLIAHNPSRSLGQTQEVLSEGTAYQLIIRLLLNVQALRKELAVVKRLNPQKQVDRVITTTTTTGSTTNNIPSIGSPLPLRYTVFPQSLDTCQPILNSAPIVMNHNATTGPVLPKALGKTEC